MLRKQDIGVKVKFDFSFLKILVKQLKIKRNRLDKNGSIERSEK
jgi:hypothetical protein